MTLYFHLTKNKLIPQYSFNLGKLKMPHDIRVVFTEWTRRYNDYGFINDIFQTPDYLFLKANLGGKSQSNVLGIFDKKSKELVFCQPANSENPLYKNGIYNDIDAGPKISPIKMINDYTIAMVIDAKQLKDHVKSNDFKNTVTKYPEKKKQLEELANKLTEFDNPLIILVTIKR